MVLLLAIAVMSSFLTVCAAVDCCASLFCPPVYLTQARKRGGREERSRVSSRRNGRRCRRGADRSHNAHGGWEGMVRGPSEDFPTQRRLPEKQFLLARRYYIHLLVWVSLSLYLSQHGEHALNGSYGSVILILSCLFVLAFTLTATC